MGIKPQYFLTCTCMTLSISLFFDCAPIPLASSIYIASIFSNHVYRLTDCELDVLRLYS